MRFASRISLISGVVLIAAFTWLGDDEFHDERGHAHCLQFLRSSKFDYIFHVLTGVELVNTSKIDAVAFCDAVIQILLVESSALARGPGNTIRQKLNVRFIETIANVAVLLRLRDSFVPRS
jgi:hypothetical protein